MSPFDRTTGANRLPDRSRWRRAVSAVLPWLFVAAVVAATMSPIRHWVRAPFQQRGDTADSPAARDAEMIVRRAGSPDLHHAVDVLWTIDGDTFEARVHLEPGVEAMTRVRLRGIDAPELKAQCPEELQMAQAATVALRALLGEGGVTIFNIGPDKYNGRIDADVATRKTPNVSAAMLASGHARSYNGGHRSGWCANAGPSVPK